MAAPLKCSVCKGKVERTLPDDCDSETYRYACQKCGRVKDIKRRLRVIDMSSSKKKTCPKCVGEGSIVTSTYSYGGMDSEVLCPDCDGEGIVDA